MRKFHSTISRRDFMKGLGLTGAGLGAAAASAPVFHDLDELAAVPGAPKHPWYVKELEQDTLSVEVDWNLVKRHDGTNHQNATEEGAAIYNESRNRGGDSSTYRTAYLKEKYPDWQGPTLRDEALSGAGSATRLPMYGSYGDEGHLGQIPVPNRIGREVSACRIPTPEDRGFPKWSGSPEEALAMLRQAVRFFGGFEIGCVEMTSNTRKLIHQFSGNKRYAFKDVSGPEVTDTELVIPNGFTHMIHFTTMEPSAQVRHAPASTYTGYDPYGRVVARMHYFLGSLGYEHMDMGGATFSNPWASLAGVAETGRAGNIATSYKYGNLIRGQHRVLTNMPIEFTRPIDAGVARFCDNCMTCAEACPYDAMDLRTERSWEHWHDACNRLGAYASSGFKGYRTSVLLCPKCKNCHGTCPFDAQEHGTIHQVVRATQATTSIFNSFFASMHRAFGYSTRNPEEWWEHDVFSGFYSPSFINA